MRRNRLDGAPRDGERGAREGHHRGAVHQWPVHPAAEDGCAHQGDGGGPSDDGGPVPAPAARQADHSQGGQETDRDQHGQGWLRSEEGLHGRAKRAQCGERRLVSIRDELLAGEGVVDRGHGGDHPGTNEERLPMASGGDERCGHEGREVQLARACRKREGESSQRPSLPPDRQQAEQERRQRPDLGVQVDGVEEGAQPE